MIDRARAWIDDAAHVVAFSGAGLSAESGVPAFRDAATRGHWTQHDPMRLASPEGFAEDPTLVLEWYAERRRGLAAVEPNAAHRALAARPEIRNVTQNVDDLLERAGVRDAVHLHGTLGRDRCHAACGHIEPIDLVDPPPPRVCPECGAPMRPDVVWFGETLPETAWTEAAESCLACEVLLVIGTAATVYPAAGLIDVARGAGARVIVVNTNPSEASGRADIELIGPAGSMLALVLA